MQFFQLNIVGKLVAGLGGTDHYSLSISVVIFTLIESTDKLA
jgi:hypothetical protein